MIDKEDADVALANALWRADAAVGEAIDLPRSFLEAYTSLAQEVRALLRMAVFDVIRISTGLYANHDTGYTA